MLLAQLHDQVFGGMGADFFVAVKEQGDLAEIALLELVDHKAHGGHAKGKTYAHVAGAEAFSHIVFDAERPLGRLALGPDHVQMPEDEDFRLARALPHGSHVEGALSRRGSGNKRCRGAKRAKMLRHDFSQGGDFGQIMAARIHIGQFYKIFTG